MVHNKIKAGLRDGIPIGLGYFSVSFTFGMLAVKSGISPFHAVLISLLNLTSAGQFAGLTVIVSGASLLEMALTVGHQHTVCVDVRVPVPKAG